MHLHIPLHTRHIAKSAARVYYAYMVVVGEYFGEIREKKKLTLTLFIEVPKQ